MLRATHFVLLFVVFACAHAAPASDEGPAVIASAPDLGSTPMAVKEPLSALPGSDDLADKEDLETAANSHGHHRGGGGWGHHGGGGWGHHGGRGWDHHGGGGHGGGWDHHRGGGYWG